ncbi:Hexadecenal dehydrogenase [Cystobasidiomycetes sp. EMM_F5]
MAGYTPLSAIPDIVAGVKAEYYSGKTRSVTWRRTQLRSLGYLVKDNEDQIYDVIHKDLGRGKNESYIVGYIILLHSRKYQPSSTTLSKLKQSLKNGQRRVLGTDASAYQTYTDDHASSITTLHQPEKVNAGLQFALMSPTIYKEPKGVALIIGTWNYPVSLVLQPLIGAIAAGCPAILKLSEVAPATAAFLAETIPKYLDGSCYKVLLGEADVTTRLLEEAWGHVFYTGSGRIAKLIAGAAAKTLSPVTLELGGKSPVIIDGDLDDLATAAKRIMWAKRFNAGQVCLSPDFILVPRSKQDALVDNLQRYHQDFFPNADLKQEDYTHIVSYAHWNRLDKVLSKTKGTTVVTGQKDLSSKTMGITIIKDVSWDDEVMQDELFGPILPIVPVDSTDEILHKLQGKTPLALYIFSKSQAFVDRIRNNTISGAVLVNELLLHNVIGALPFGGVGESGSGSYHGKKSFDTFTHERASISFPFWADWIFAIRYYPHTDKKAATFKVINKQITFPRPGQEEKFLSRTLRLKYALAVLLVAFIFRKQSWLLPQLHFDTLRQVINFLSQKSKSSLSL